MKQSWREVYVIFCETLLGVIASQAQGLAHLLSFSLLTHQGQPDTHSPESGGPMRLGPGSPHSIVAVFLLVTGHAVITGERGLLAEGRAKQAPSGRHVPFEPPLWPRVFFWHLGAAFVDLFRCLNVLGQNGLMNFLLCICTRGCPTDWARVPFTPLRGLQFSGWFFGVTFSNATPRQTLPRF